MAAVVENYLTNEGSGAPYAVHTFESVLRRHKQTFLSLLKNPVSIQITKKCTKTILNIYNKYLYYFSFRLKIQLVEMK